MKVRSPKAEVRRKSEVRVRNAAEASVRRVLGLRISDFGLPSAFGFRLSVLLSLPCSSHLCSPLPPTPRALTTSLPCVRRMPRCRPHSGNSMAAGSSSPECWCWRWLALPSGFSPGPSRRSSCRRRSRPARRWSRCASRPEDGALLSQVSQILRHYVVAAFDLPPGELTTAEFCRAIAGHARIGPELVRRPRRVPPPVRPAQVLPARARPAAQRSGAGSQAHRPGPSPAHCAGSVRSPPDPKPVGGRPEPGLRTMTFLSPFPPAAYRLWDFGLWTSSFGLRHHDRQPGVPISLAAGAAGVAADLRLSARAHRQARRPALSQRRHRPRRRRRRAGRRRPAAALPAAAHGGPVHRRAGRAALRQRPHRDAGQRRGHHARARPVLVHDGAGHGRAAGARLALRHRLARCWRISSASAPATGSG